MSRHGNLGACRAAACRAAACVAVNAITPAHAHDVGVRRVRYRPSKNGVATHFLVSRPGLVGLVLRHNFGITTWLAFMASQPIVGVATQRLQGEPIWCRDTLFGVATHFLVSRHGSGNLVSRHNFWCRNMVLSFWCHDPQFGVTIWSSLIGVAT